VARVRPLPQRHSSGSGYGGPGRGQHHSQLGKGLDRADRHELTRSVTRGRRRMGSSTSRSSESSSPEIQSAGIRFHAWSTTPSGSTWRAKAENRRASGRFHRPGAGVQPLHRAFEKIPFGPLNVAVIDHLSHESGPGGRNAGPGVFLRLAGPRHEKKTDSRPSAFPVHLSNIRMARKSSRLTTCDRSASGRKSYAAAQAGPPGEREPKCHPGSTGARAVPTCNWTSGLAARKLGVT
jgi:hypothetical protein